MRGRAPLGAAAALAIGVVAGFVLGGIGPRRDAARSREEIARLDAELRERRGEGRGRSPLLDRFFRAPEGGSPAVRERVDDEPPGERPGDEPPGERPDDEPTVLPAAADGGVPSGRPGRDSPTANEGGFDEFQAMITVQEARRTQSRAALVEQAGLREDEVRELDAALDEMNGELGGYGEELMLYLTGEPPSARELLGITHDVTGILHRAQERIEGLLGPERAQAVESNALEVWNFIDLAGLEPAARAAFESAP